MQVMVKYKAVTYMVFFDGPLISSGAFVSLDHTYEYGFWVTFANFHSQLNWICKREEILSRLFRTSV